MIAEAHVWVVVEIGCIECGDENNWPVVGVYSTQAGAAAKMAELRAEYEVADDRNERLGFSRRLTDDTNGFHGAESQVRLIEVEVQP